MAKSGIKHIDVGDELTKAEWESEQSHALVHGNVFPAGPVERQLFYRDDEHILYVYNGTSWISTQGVGGKNTKIADADGDTKVDVEEAADEDKVRMDVKGVEAFLLDNAGVLTLVKQSLCRVRVSTSQTIPTGVWTKLNLDTVRVDQQSEFDTVNHKFVAKKAGIYIIITSAGFSPPVPDGTRIGILLDKNGVHYGSYSTITTGGANVVAIFSADLAVLAVDDYLEAIIYQDSGVDQLAEATEYGNYMAVIKIA